MRTRVVISVAHTEKSPGVHYECYNEHALSWFWSLHLNCELKKLGITNEIIHSNKVSSLDDKTSRINQIEPDLALEIHFNACGDDRVRGSETLYYPGSDRGKSAAMVIQEYLSEYCKPDRGVKEGWYQGNKEKGALWFLKKTKCLALIIEPQFIQAGKDIAIKAPFAAKSIANGIKEILDNLS